MSYFALRQRTSRLLIGLAGAAVLLFGAVDDLVLLLVELTTVGVALLWAWQRTKAPYTLVWTALYAPFAVVIAAGALQLLLGGSALPVATSGSLAIWITYLLFFALSFHCQIDPWIRRETMRWMALGGGALGAIAVVQRVLNPGAALTLRAAPGADPLGPFAQAEHLTVVFELLLPLALLGALEGGARAWRWHGAAAAMVLAVVLGRSQIGLGLVGIEVAIFGVLMLLELRRNLKKDATKALRGLTGVSLSAIILLAGALITGSTPRTASFAQSFSLADPEMRAAVDQMFRAQPLTGHGLGAFDAAFQRFSPADQRSRWVHLENDPVQMTLELGVSGAACQTLFAGLALLLTFGLSRRAWLGALLPLAVAWVHSWAGFPFEIPAVALTALLLLARIPAEGVPRVRRRRRIDGAPIGSPRGAPIY